MLVGSERIEQCEGTGEKKNPKTSHFVYHQTKRNALQQGISRETCH